MRARGARSGGRRRDLVRVELVDVSDLTEGPPHVLHQLHLFERSAERIGSGAHRIHHGLPRRFGGVSCFLASGARRLGCDPSLLAGDARCLSGVPQLLSLLSDGFERFAMIVANFTRLLGHSPELFRLIPSSLRGYAVFFRNLRDFGMVIHGITCPSVPAMARARCA